VGLAYNYMRTNGAKLMSEASYPYTGRQGATCRYAAAQGVAGIRSYASVTAGSESSLLAQAAVGPVAVAIDSSKRSYIYYSGGYYYEPTCSTSYLDHAVLVVGWGTDATHGDYWLVKNQWGACTSSLRCLDGDDGDDALVANVEGECVQRGARTATSRWRATRATTAVSPRWPCGPAWRPPAPPRPTPACACKRDQALADYGGLAPAPL
jgi:hypothetical protein